MQFTSTPDLCLLFRTFGQERTQKKRKKQQDREMVGTELVLKRETLLISSGFRSLHGSVKQRERKKFIMYSIYAWGCAIILTTFCMVMDLVPNIPIDFPRPQFGQGSCWFHSKYQHCFINISNDCGSRSCTQ